MGRCETFEVIFCSVFSPALFDNVLCFSLPIFFLSSFPQFFHFFLCPSFTIHELVSRRYKTLDQKIDFHVEIVVFWFVSCISRLLFVMSFSLNCYLVLRLHFVVLPFHCHLSLSRYVLLFYSHLSLSRYLENQSSKTHLSFMDIAQTPFALSSIFLMLSPPTS